MSTWGKSFLKRQGPPIFGRSESLLQSRAAAYEVDDYQAVAVFQWRLGPAVTGDYFAVEFYGYAIGLHVQGFDQGGEGKGTLDGRCGGGVLFSIDVQFHCLWDFTDSSRLQRPLNE